MNSVQDRVIEKLNREIGSDIKNLHKSRYLIQNYKQQFKDIEGKLKLDDVKYTSGVKNAITNSEKTKNTITFELEKINLFDGKLSTKITDCNKILNDVKPHLEKVQNLQHLVEYLKVVQDIQEINISLGNAVQNGKDETKIVGLFLSLSGELNSSNSIIGRLQDIEAPFLKTYANKSGVYWYQILKEKFSKEFESLLKAIKWPPQTQVLENFLPSKENMNKITLLAEYLFLIKSPEDDSSELINITPFIICPPISTPTQLLLNSFRQRFLYHFTGTRQTNRLDKPEWYFTQILNWGKENHLFVGKHFQPAAAKAGHENFNIRLEFIRGLVQLAIAKLAYDIVDISKDESLFAHLLDETLAFEIELRESLGYPNSFPSAISVITQPQYLLKWISIEERFCTDKIDLVLQGDSPWTLIDTNNTEDLKIPKCADQFIRLLDSIKDRYCALTQPGHQLQFLNLQLELIDNFRLRLVQLYSSGSVDITRIMNAINYVTSVLKEWGENVHYLHLHAALVGPNAHEINSVFDQSVDELDHWQKKLIKNISHKIVDEIKAKSMSYRHDNWSMLTEQNSNEPFILSASASEMFQVMMTNLHNLERDLSLNLFNITIRLISQQLDDFFYDSMVMNTKFSVGGATQFQFDMTRNLFALFGQYSRRPDLLFKKIHDVCLLLNAPKGNTLLLHQTLKENLSCENKLNALKEIGVINLKPDACIDILERRKDIRFY